MPPNTVAYQDRDTQGGACPEHGTQWAIQPAGNRKSDGKAYGAFYKCGGKTPDDRYCPAKPVKAWVEEHPIPKPIPADNLPF